MNNTEYSHNVAELFTQLKDKIGHDAEAATLLANLHDHLKGNIDALAIEKRVDEQVCATYEMATFTDNEGTPSSYLEFFATTLARLGFALSMARESKVSNDDLEYLSAKVTDAVNGNFDAKALTIAIQTQVEAQRFVESVFTPLIELTQRVLNVETPTPFYKREHLENLLSSKRQGLKVIEEAIAAYDSSVEEAFQENVARLLETEETRLKLFRTEGYKDPAVEVSPIFEFYEDQLLLNIQTLKRQQTWGSQARQSHEADLTRLDETIAEIAGLEQSLRGFDERGRGAKDAHEDLPGMIADMLESDKAAAAFRARMSEAGYVMKSDPVQTNGSPAFEVQSRDGSRKFFVSAQARYFTGSDAGLNDFFKAIEAADAAANFEAFEDKMEAAGYGRSNLNLIDASMALKAATTEEEREEALKLAVIEQNLHEAFERGQS